MDSLKAENISLEELHNFMEKTTAKKEPDIFYTIGDPLIYFLSKK